MLLIHFFTDMFWVQWEGITGNDDAGKAEMGFFALSVLWTDLISMFIQVKVWIKLGKSIFRAVLKNEIFSFLTIIFYFIW